jgi:CelD/BcsL family acetyltransferase involved in cellulose biosynthesis
MCVLCVDGRKIAMELALTSGSVCFSPKIAYDETFSNTSPGALLVQRIISDLTRHGFTRYDLLGSQGRHKAMWAGEVREHASMYVIRPNLLGRFHHLLLGSIAPRMRALRHRVYGDPQSLQPRGKKPSA